MLPLPGNNVWSVFSECAVDDDLICTSGSDLSTDIRASSTRVSSNDDHGAARACLNTVDEEIKEQSLFPALCFGGTAGIRAFD